MRRDGCLTPAESLLQEVGGDTTARPNEANAGFNLCIC